MKANLSSLGKLVPYEEIENDFSPHEGEIQMVFGQIGNGKTTECVRRILTALQNGEVVYTNVKLDLTKISFDERLKLGVTFFKFIFWRKRYYKFDKKNYHYVNIDDFENIDALITYLNSLTDCQIHWDEGWYLLDSYERDNKEKRRLVYHTRHFARKITIYSQRVNSISVNGRSQINRFFECEKLMSWPWVLLRVTEYQELKDDMPDKEFPAHRINYFANNKYFSVFNTHELRGGVPKSQKVHAEAYDLTFGQRITALFVSLIAKFKNAPIETSIPITFDNGETKYMVKLEGRGKKKKGLLKAILP